jgi:hypothetical protein
MLSCLPAEDLPRLEIIGPDGNKADLEGQVSCRLSIPAIESWPKVNLPSAAGGSEQVYTPFNGAEPQYMPHSDRARSVEGAERATVLFFTVSIGSIIALPDRILQQ